MLKKLCILMAVIMSFALVGCSESDKFAGQRGSDDDMQFIERETEDMVDCLWFIWEVAANTNMNPIILKHSDENAIFECTVDKGHFVFTGYVNGKRYVEYFKSLVLKSGDGLPFPIGPDDGSCCQPYPDGVHRCGIDGFVWWPYEIGPYPGPSLDREIRQAFVEIVLKIDNNIIGYAVVEIYSADEYGHEFMARVLKSALFPKIDGEYQNVTQEYVKTIIQRIKNK